MPRPSKRAHKVRSASEFDLVRLAAELRPPHPGISAFAWGLEEIRGARDEQMQGLFTRPARLAEAMRTDYALYAAFLNRLAPQRGLPVVLTPAKSNSLGKRITDEAAALFGPGGVGIRPDTLVDINAQLANHGVAFACNVATPRADGSRVDFETKAWPIDNVYWRPFEQCFYTRVLNGQDEPITHGDGRWIVFRTTELEPWKHGAVLPAALVWASHAFANRDLGKAGTAHGNAKVVGTLPEGVDLNGEHGRAFLELLRFIASVDSPYGVKPFGSQIDYITNNSNAWQVFSEAINTGDRAAARIYLGQDGTMGTQSVGPGIDTRGLFGVRNDIVEGDLRAIERGLLTGVIEPWAAINFGDSSLAPSRVYKMPDADEDARRDALAKQHKAFFDVVQAARNSGFDALNAEYIEQLSADFGITAPPVKVAAPIASTPTPNAGLATQSPPEQSPAPGPGASDQSGEPPPQAQ